MASKFETYWQFALLRRTLGFRRGMHNYHHAYPTSDRHGLVWCEIDMIDAVDLSTGKWFATMPAQ
jgi:fatty-acid desaturase